MGKGDGVPTAPEMKQARRSAFWGNLLSMQNATSWRSVLGYVSTIGAVYATTKGLPPEAGAAVVGAVGTVAGILIAHPN